MMEQETTFPVMTVMTMMMSSRSEAKSRSLLTWASEDKAGSSHINSWSAVHIAVACLMDYPLLEVILPDG